MATITLRVDDKARDDLEALARGRGATVSDLLRASIFEMLGRDVPTDDTSSTPLTLTVVERCHLALQHESLAMLHSDDEHEADYHRRMVEVLTKGYTGEYYRVFAGISPELSRRDCRLLRDLLDMFCVLKASLDRLDAAEKNSLGEGAEVRLSFQGFDFNDAYESRLANYAQHLIDTDRWQDLAENFDDEHERGNSHSPRLATYLRMLESFQPIWSAKVKDSGLSHDDRYALNLNELHTVLAAWPYPRK
ncbi:YfbU family protein [Actinoallomurus acaciae]|uniref:YfbU family protein n=1 Tax=Actinoallomurus acaciae TaxID=502577 RepID=A0ABV5YHH7_9ACTN